MQSRVEDILTAIIDGGTLDNFTPQSRNEEILVALLNKLNGEEVGTLPDPQSRMEALLEAVLEKVGPGGGATGDYIKIAATSAAPYQGFSGYSGNEYSTSIRKTITEINLPTVATIASGAFAGCNALETLNLPAVTEISSGAFSACSKLGEVNLPACTTLNAYSFSGCTGIKRVILPKAKFVNGFSGCTSIEYIYLGQDVNSIGQSAFGGVPVTCKVECGFAEGAISGFPANGGWNGDPAELDITYNVPAPTV